MKSIKTIFSTFNIDSRADKYLSREFQKYGIYLAERLGDMGHKALYIKMAKEEDRKVLNRALSFVLDAHAKSKARLFMWKIRQIKDQRSNLKN